MSKLFKWRGHTSLVIGTIYTVLGATFGDLHHIQGAGNNILLLAPYTRCWEQHLVIGSICTGLGTTFGFWHHIHSAENNILLLAPINILNF